MMIHKENIKAAIDKWCNGSKCECNSYMHAWLRAKEETNWPMTAGDEIPSCHSVSRYNYWRDPFGGA